MSELNKHTIKPKAEHMTKKELVVEFRTLQRWYNNMKVAVDQLEKQYAELQQAYDESVNLNLTLKQRVENLQTLLQNQITDANENKQMLHKRIQDMQMKVEHLKQEA